MVSEQDCELLSLGGGVTVEIPVDLGGNIDGFLKLLKVKEGRHIELN